MNARQEQEQDGNENEGQDSDNNDANTNIQPPAAIHINKVADNITNHGELNVVNNKVRYWCIVRVA